MEQEIQAAELKEDRIDENYSLSDEDVQQEYTRSRTAEKWVGFFLPHLRPGMSLLDCGCGVGSITVDLAEKVAPGEVIGVDIDEGQLEIAKSLANERGIRNVRFELASVHMLQFSEASFDAVLAHTLLMHLSDPLEVLKKMRRLLKPGGIIGVSDDDYSTLVHSPSSPALEKAAQLWPKIVTFNGGSPSYSRGLRGLLRKAGFSQTEGHAVAADYYGTLQGTRHIAELFIQLFSDPSISELVVQQGWANSDELREMAEGMRIWGECPDAFAAIMYCAAVGWK